MKDLSPFVELDYVLSKENSNSEYIEAAIFGAHAGNQYIKKCMEKYHNRHFIKEDGSYDYPFIIPDIMMQCIGKFTILENIEDFKSGQSIMQIFPPRFFGPKNYSTGKFDQLTDDSYSIHHFSGSWRPFKMRMNRFIWRKLRNGPARFVQKTYQLFKKLL